VVSTNPAAGVHGAQRVKPKYGRCVGASGRTCEGGAADAGETAGTRRPARARGLAQDPPAPSSDRLGWVRLEAARCRAAPAFKVGLPALTDHRLFLFTRPRDELDLRYDHRAGAHRMELAHGVIDDHLFHSLGARIVLNGHRVELDHSNQKEAAHANLFSRSPHRDPTRC
jgi:hypothetical protein